MRIHPLLITALLFVSPSLYAHTGGHIENSLFSGFVHPLTGIDHLLVLLAVGLIAAKHGGKATIAFPAVFLALMAVGAVLSSYGLQIPFAESLIALSLMAFALLLTIGRRQHSEMFFLATSVFAVFHGYAHAAEMPDGAAALHYFSSLMLASLFICLFGCALGFTAGKRFNHVFSLACLTSGLYFLASA